MDRGKLHFSSSKARRGLLYVMVIGCLALVGMPTRDVDSMPRESGKIISFGPRNNVGANESATSVVALGDLDNNGDLDIVSGSGFYASAAASASPPQRALDGRACRCGMRPPAQRCRTTRRTHFDLGTPIHLGVRFRYCRYSSP